MVELKEYPATVDCRKRTAANAKQLATLNSAAPDPSFTILGGASSIGGRRRFTHSPIRPTALRAEKGSAQWSAPGERIPARAPIIC